MQQEIRKATAEAYKAELDADAKAAEEADRKARGGINRRLSLTGAIMDTEQAIAILEHWESRDPGEPITITINSPGGSVFDGNALFDTIQRLRRKGHHVTTRGSGHVMSYGAVLLQAGDVRILDKNTVFMIHGLSAPVYGDIDTIADTTAMFKKVQDRLIDILAERAKVSKLKIKQMIKRKDLFLSADEALKYGFCDIVE